jgi:hypothetical protein
VIDFGQVVRAQEQRGGADALIQVSRRAGTYDGDLDMSSSEFPGSCYAACPAGGSQTVPRPIA